MAKRREDNLPVADPVRERLSTPSPVANLAAAAAARPRRQKAPSPQVVPPAAESVGREVSASVDAPSQRTAEVSRQVPPQVANQRTNAQVVERSAGPKKRVQQGPEPEKASQVKKTRFTVTEVEDNERVLRLIRNLTGTKASESSITRVLWSLLRASEQELKHEARAGVAMYRPPNGTSLEMASYEDDLARFLHGALKALDR